jgi:hypothetical protein
MLYPFDGSTTLKLRFAGTHAKLDRAREHAKTLESEIRAWNNQIPFSATKQVNPEQTRFGVVVKVHHQPPLKRWSVIFGDFVHNLRCALDHMVYLIAVHETNQDPPCKKWRDLAFPIAETPKRFSDIQSRRIGILSDPVRAAIESVQPYNRKHSEDPPALLMLSEFDNADKHRLLQVAISHPIGGRIQHDRDPGAPVPQFFAHVGEVRDGTELMALEFPTPQAHVKYKFTCDIGIAVRHIPNSAGITISELAAITNLLNREVSYVIATVLKRVKVFNP